MEMSDDQERQIQIIVATDKMTAEIMYCPADEEPILTTDTIKQALEKSGVTYGIMEDAIENFCRNPLSYENKPLQIAAGLEPVAGTDGYVEYVFSNNELDERKPKELDDGRVDFYNVLQIANVSRGQLLAKKHPATPGVNGVTVTGETAMAKAGKEAVLKPGKNVILNEDRTLLYSVIDGQLSFSENDKVNVFPVFEVNGDVDFRVGNIDFVGTVVIRGNVPTGFRIKASGDIRVHGSVEGAELIAGGSIEIKSGIVAQDKGEVTAGCNVIASYIQNGNVNAGMNVQVSQSIMFSNIRAGKNVICQGTKGIIIGGTIQAGEKIIAQVVGNSTSTPTCLEVGVKPELRNELTTITKELQLHYENLRKTEQGLNVLDQLLKVSGELPQDKKVLQIKLRNTQLMIEKEIKKFETRKKQLEEEIDNESAAVVEINQIVFPGTKLVFGKWTRFVRQEYSRTRFLVIDNEIRTSSII